MHECPECGRSCDCDRTEDHVCGECALQWHTCPDCGQECDCPCGDRPPEIGCTHDCWQPVEYEDYFDDFS